MLVTYARSQRQELNHSAFACAVTIRWWGDWCAYTNYRNAAWDSNNGADDSEPSTCPDSIDNSDITGIDADDDLRPGLEEDKDFVIVRGKSWDLLAEWYGGGPPIKRSAVLEGLLPSSKRPRVNPYPMKLEVCWSGQPEVVKPMKAEQNVSCRAVTSIALATKSSAASFLGSLLS